MTDKCERTEMVTWLNTLGSLKESSQVSLSVEIFSQEQNFPVQSIQVLYDGCLDGVDILAAAGDVTCPNCHMGGGWPKRGPDFFGQLDGQGRLCSKRHCPMFLNKLCHCCRTDCKSFRT